MKNPSSFRRLALALGCAASLTFIAPLASAAELATPRAEKKALPVTAAFEKDATEKGPIVLKLTNTSHAAVKVDVAVAESVLSHAKPRNRKHDYTIEAGKSATVTELAAGDKVTISAEGYESLEVVAK